MKDRVIDPRIADPFEPYLQIIKDKRRLQLILVVQFAILLVLSVGIFLTAMRPPHVIVKDRVDGSAPIISRLSTSVPIQEQDARIFFINMLKLRYGWSSLTVQRDLHSYMGQCLSSQRAPEELHFHEVLAPEAEDNHSSARRLETWIAEGIQNSLLLPDDLTAIRCLLQEDGAWVCTARGTIVTQRQVPPFMEPAPAKKLVFLATLFPVRHTIQTPYGLVLARLQHFDPPPDKGVAQ